jgi:hypothetical protein
MRRCGRGRTCRAPGMSGAPTGPPPPPPRQSPKPPSAPRGAPHLGSERDAHHRRELVNAGLHLLKGLAVLVEVQLFGGIRAQRAAALRSARRRARGGTCATGCGQLGVSVQDERARSSGSGEGRRALQRRGCQRCTLSRCFHARAPGSRERRIGSSAGRAYTIGVRGPVRTPSGSQAQRRAAPGQPLLPTSARQRVGHGQPVVACELGGPAYI